MIIKVSLHKLIGHDFDWFNALVLDEEPCYKRRLISEMIHIAAQDSSLNIQTDTANLDKSYITMLEKFFLNLPALNLGFASESMTLSFMCRGASSFFTYNTYFNKRFDFLRVILSVITV